MMPPLRGLAGVGKTADLVLSVAVKRPVEALGPRQIAIELSHLLGREHLAMLVQSPWVDPTAVTPQVAVGLAQDEARHLVVVARGDALGEASQDLALALAKPLADAGQRLHRIGQKPNRGSRAAQHRAPRRGCGARFGSSRQYAGRVGADSDDCGRGFRLNAATRSDRRRPPVPTKAAGVSLPA
jgi:hypothetical protein